MIRHIMSRHIMSRHKTFHAILIALILSAAATAQTVTSLFAFDGTDGAESYAALVQGTDGNLYGTTSGDGANNGGTVFKITTGGTLTTIYNFCSESNCADGNRPRTGLTLGTNGNFFGATPGGGAYGGGNVFEITPAGKLTTIYNFCSEANCDDGYEAVGTLIQASNGDFYGTTETGGLNGAGTVFEVTPAGKYTVLWNFCSESNCTDGSEPAAGLVQATNGDFYGTTVYGGAEGQGIVYKITSAGVLTTLHSFCSKANCDDGDNPLAPLIQASNGNLYGTTEKGGTQSGDGGTVFEITPAGKLTTLFSFNGSGDGDVIYAGVIQATDGNLYGMTTDSGPGGAGTIFKLTTGGTETTLYSFCSNDSCATGANPYASLFQSTNGEIYGVTSEAGSDYENGTVFSLSTSLAPFVETLPTSGKVGAKVTILGNGFTGTTAVSFNGTAATFKVVKSTEITATVPTGATTGKIQVTTPTKTLESNVTFRVK
jgi:uncharacterized repeat protein (TIGR03803 family)